VPGWVQLQTSGRTIAFAAAVILLTAIVFGLVPAMQPRRADLAGSLTGGAGSRTSVGLPQRRMLNTLVVIEIALALVLLTGSGLLVRAYANLRTTDPGFRPDGVMTFRLSLPSAKYKDAIVQHQFYGRLVQRLEATPGVTSAGVVTCLPFGCHWGRFLRAEGAPPPTKAGSTPVVLTRYASDTYFKTMGIQLVRGRVFGPDEGRAGGPHPAVINEQLAKQLWPNADPIGRRMIWSGDTVSGDWMTIVGVVKDVRHYGLVNPMIGGFYLSESDVDTSRALPSLGVAVRSAGDPAVLAAQIRSIVRDLDPELPLIELQTAHAALNRSIAQRRTIAFAFAGFGVVALVLALGGIYAVLSYVVGRRRQEIGIRMALGARRGQVVQLVVRQGLTLVGLGVLIGLPVSLLVLRELSSLLVGVTARDPLTYVLAIGLLAGTTVISALIPARRAASVDPKTALGDS